MCLSSTPGESMPLRLLHLLKELLALLFILGSISIPVLGLQAHWTSSPAKPRTLLGSSISSSTNDNDDMSTLSCRIGFIGTGTIASAIVSGLATQSSIQVKSIAVSKRSESKSKYLVEKFPDLVTVYDDNQSLVNDADIIFLTVLPQQTKSVLESIKFDGSRHLLVSLVSTSELGDLCEDSGLPKDSIYKMICLPAVASHDGVCLLTPPVPTSSHGGETLKALLQSLGGVVEAGSEDEMSVMMVTTGLMGSFYGILKNNRDWLVRQGVPVEKASFLVGRQYRAMVLDADSRCSNPTAFEELIDEQTPGGLNEQGLSNLNQLGALEMYDKVQDALLERILGKSDGTLK